MCGRSIVPVIASAPLQQCFQVLLRLNNQMNIQHRRVIFCRFDNDRAKGDIEDEASIHHINVDFVRPRFHMRANHVPGKPGWRRE